MNDLAATTETFEFPSEIFKLLLQALEAQKKQHETNTLEAEGGPEPATTQSGFGANEKRQIKKYSRHPYGFTIAQTYLSGCKVLTVVGGDGEVSPFYQWFQENRLSHKMPVVFKDSFVGGTGFLELFIDPTTQKLCANVLSPKNTTVLTIDRVNDEYADLAIQEVVYNGVKVYKVWDAQNEYTFSNVAIRGRAQYEATRVVSHGLKICPVLHFDDLVDSDGQVKSIIEVLTPALQTIRLVTASTSLATYWQGLKQMIIAGVDRDQTRIDPESGESITLYEDLINELHKSDENEALLLPVSDTPGKENPSLIQTQEANIGQLTQIIKETKNTVAGLAGIPLQHLDPTATPQTAEGSAQSYMVLDSLLDTKRENFSSRIFSMYRVWCEITGTEVDWDTHVIWAAGNRASLNALSDTVAKLVASNIPLKWIVNNVIAKSGFTPKEIEELKNDLDDQASAQGEFNRQLMKGF